MLALDIFSKCLVFKVSVSGGIANKESYFIPIPRIRFASNLKCVCAVTWVVFVLIGNRNSCNSLSVRQAKRRKLGISVSRTTSLCGCRVNGTQSDHLVETWPGRSEQSAHLSSDISEHFLYSLTRLAAHLVMMPEEILALGDLVLAVECLHIVVAGTHFLSHKVTFVAAEEESSVFGTWNHFDQVMGQSIERVHRVVCEHEQSRIRMLEIWRRHRCHSFQSARVPKLQLST